MKFESDRRYDTIAAYVLAVLLFDVLLVFIGLYFENIAAGVSLVLGSLKPLIYALFFAVLFYPMERFFHENIFRFLRGKPRLRRALAIICTYLVVAAVITLFAMIIIPQAVTSYTDLESKIPGYMTAARAWINDKLESLPSFELGRASQTVRYPKLELSPGGKLPDVLISRLTDCAVKYNPPPDAAPRSFRLDIAGAVNGVIDNSYTAITGLSPYVFSFAMNFVTEAKNLLFGLIISVYYLISRRSIEARMRLAGRAFLPEKAAQAIEDLLRLVNRSLIDFIIGKIIDAAIIGALCFIFMSVFGMPYAPLISLLVGVTNVIPYLGPFLGAIPGAFIIFVSEPPMAFWFVLLIIALQQTDSYFIEPNVIRTQLSLDPVWIIVSIVIMGALFGIVGMFIGVPLFYVFYVLVKRLVEGRLKKKCLPEDTGAWMKV